MKKIKHKPDFEPFALVIETEEEANDLWAALQVAGAKAKNESREHMAALDWLEKLGGPCDE